MHVTRSAAGLALSLMDQQGITIGINASGGHPGQGLEASVEIAGLSDGRLLPLCNLDFGRVAVAGFAAYAVETLSACKQLGAVGLKVSKYVGLGLQDASGRLVAVDDPALDPVFEQAGVLGLPVLIHSGDPLAFFERIGPQNERHAELSIHPGWSFHGLAPNGEPWPSWESLLAQFERRVARHPATTFIGAHFGNAAERPERVAALLDANPNYAIDTAARVPEFGRHDAARMRAFFVRYQDRILFGSDMGVAMGGLVLGSGDGSPGTPARAEVFFEAHWAYFETREPGLRHPTPIQGDWTVDGIGLPREVLEKLYWRNATRLFSLHFPPESPAGR